MEVLLVEQYPRIRREGSGSEITAKRCQRLALAELSMYICSDGGHNSDWIDLEQGLRGSTRRESV